MKFYPVCFATLILLAGCAITQKDDPNIPRVTPALVAAGGAGTTKTLLEHGRETYTEDCTRCHAAEPVGKYTMARWRVIVAEMGDRADLPAEPRAALLAYLMAATGDKH